MALLQMKFWTISITSG